MDDNIKIKTEPTTERTSSSAHEPTATSKPALTKGGAKKRTFIPKATVRQARPVVKEEESERNDHRKEGFRRDRSDRGNSFGRGRGRGRGRENIVLHASGPFSLGPAGLGSHFKKAQPIYSGISETRGGGSSSFSGKKKGVNFEEEENNEEYEDAELMIHVEGGEQLKHDDAMGTKEELLAAEVSRQLSGLDLHEDKMAAFVDSLDVGKREDVPNSGLPLVFMQLPAVLPHMAKKASVPPENMDDSLGLEAKQEIIADSPIEQLSGHVGKLLFYKSGKVQLRFGQVLFDINSGLNLGFHQEIVALDQQNGEAFVLGDIRRRFVCTPNIDSLLES